MICDGEGEVVIEEFPKFLSKGGSELWTTVGDDFAIESKAKVDLVDKEDGCLFGSNRFLVGQRITPFIRPWLTMTSKESKPEEMGRSVIRSQETCWKGQKV